MAQIISESVEQLLGRAGGPMHLRLILQPLMAAILATRAGVRDARQGSPPFFWTLLTSREARRMLARSGWKDLSKIFTVAVVLDLVYQWIALDRIHPVQTLIVAVAVAVVPYALLRGMVTRLISGVPRLHQRVGATKA